MICPKCETSHRCICKSCFGDMWVAYTHPEKNPPPFKSDHIDYFQVREEGHLMKCQKCGHRFNQDESMDVEWELMVREYQKSMTKELFLEYLFYKVTNNHNKLSKFVKNHKEFDSNAMVYRVFYKHFGERIQDVEKIGMSWIRNQKIDLTILN